MVPLTEATAETTAEIYRERAKRARAQAAVASSSRSRREWREIADDYERLAAFVERATIRMDDA
jgi:hypothetical protein